MSQKKDFRTISFIVCALLHVSAVVAIIRLQIATKRLNVQPEAPTGVSVRIYNLLRCDTV